MIDLFIISYNRLSFLKQQIDFFSKNPVLKIHIVDNCSTYAPLLEYLSKSLHIVYVMPDNAGHQVIWKNNLSQVICPNKPYMVTDNDVIPEDPNFHELLLQGLKKFPDINKIGLGLRTDDIPDHNPLRDQIIHHENEVLKREDVYDARFIKMPVDTTLAIIIASSNTGLPELC